jgi:hypothetical protein
MRRFNSTLSNYRSTRKYSGDFILLVHDIWGADGGQSADSVYPGDNGDWSEMEASLFQLTEDIKANNMLEGLVLDIWNDHLANLLYKDDGEYYPNGNWHLYNYYAGMAGNQAKTVASAALEFDVFATLSGSRVKVLAGTRTIQAPYDISIQGLSSLGFLKHPSPHVSL